MFSARSINNYLKFFLFAGAPAFLAGCSGGVGEVVERGSTYRYSPGYPEVRLSAIGVVGDDDSTKISLAADIVFGSLVFKNVDGKLKADILVEISIKDLSLQDQYTAPIDMSFSIINDNPGITSSQDVFTFERDLPTPPGEYEVSLGVLDANSSRQTIRTVRASIPNPKDDISHLTNIRLMGKGKAARNGEFFPITTYDVQNDLDSLKFVFQVTNYISNQPLTVETRLVKFAADTTPSRPITYNNYGPSSISFKGIDYDKEEVIQTTTRDIFGNGSILIEFPFKNLPRGNYRFEARTSVNESELFQARDFSVKSQSYPAIRTPREMAQPLSYLMDEKEYKQLMAINSPDSLKRAVDRFWLKSVKDPKVARSVISLYYERVEEANKQFSNFKEGWKTDMGMIYILFGPPLFTNDSLTESVWSYSYNITLRDEHFIFRNPRIKTNYFPFDHFLLQRSSIYYNNLYNQVQLWLSGGILKTSL